MSDLLVRLYDLPGLEVAITRQRARAIVIRRALAPDKASVLKWVRRHWGAGWASECDVAQGYAYAIIGGVGPHVQGFYEKAVGAVLIEGSEPGVYGGML